MRENLPRIFDCFTYDAEDIVYPRIELIGEHIHRFYIVEGSRTFQGKTKQQCFDINRVPERFRDKVHYRFVDLTDVAASESAWTIEAAQRNALMTVLDEAGDDDFILLSDVDEIPNPDIFRSRLPSCARINMYNCYFYVDYICEDLPIWNKPVIFRKRALPGNVTFEQVRGGKLRYRSGHIPNGGWHFSYLGGVDVIYAKLSRFSHTELEHFSRENRDVFEEKIRNGIDIYDRNHRWGRMPHAFPGYDRMLQNKYFSNFLSPKDIRIVDMKKLRRLLRVANLKSYFRRLKYLYYR